MHGHWTVFIFKYTVTPFVPVKLQARIRLKFGTEDYICQMWS